MPLSLCAWDKDNQKKPFKPLIWRKQKFSHLDKSVGPVLKTIPNCQVLISLIFISSYIFLEYNISGFKTSRCTSQLVSYQKFRIIYFKFLSFLPIVYSNKQMKAVFIYKKSYGIKNIFLVFSWVSSVRQITRL